MRHYLVCLAVCMMTWCATAMAQSWPQESGKPLMTLVEQLKPPRATPERLQAVEALAAYEEFAVAPVAKLLRSDDQGTRFYACLALIRLGPCAGVAVPNLITVAADPNDPLRRDAVIALGRIGPAANEATPVLCDLLGENRVELRKCAVSALENIGRTGVVALAERLKSDDTAVCMAACTVFQRIGPEAEDAIPALVALAFEANEELCDAIFLTFAKVGFPAVGDLISMLQHENRHVRRLGAMMLNRMGANAAPAVFALCEASCDIDANIRFWAVRAVVEIGDADDGVAECLVRASLDEDADIRWQAAIGLRNMDIGESARQALYNMLEDTHPSVRAQAEAALIYR